MASAHLATESVPSCPACGHDQRTELFPGLTDTLFGAPGSWNLWTCKKCGVAFLDPRPTLSSIGDAYRRYYTHGDSSEWTARPPPGPEGRFAGLKLRLRNGYLRGALGYPVAPAFAAARWLVPVFFPRHRLAFDTSVRHLHLPWPGARLLDVGCGAGEFLAHARTLGWSVTGLEVDPGAARVAATQGVEVVQAPIEHAGIASASFDAVTMNHVIEHLHDPGATLREVHRVLRPGGVLWLATPNLHSPLLRRMGARWRGLEPPRHLLLFNRRALTAMLEASGFATLAWQRAYPLTRWIHSASGGGVPEPTLRLLELASAVSNRWSEQLVVTATKATEGRA